MRGRDASRALFLLPGCEIPMPVKFTTIDAHVAGDTVRFLVAGAPSLGGRTMAEKLAWVRKRGERLRRILMLEPRGHSAMHGAWLTEPASPEAYAGLLCMNAAGFPLFSGEAIIAAVTIALENQLIEGAPEELVIETPVGRVKARATWQRSAAGTARIEAVAVESVPALVLFAGAPVQLGARIVRADVAFGGEFYAIVDGESVGIPIDAIRAPQLLSAAREIRRALEQSLDIVHPQDKTWAGIDGVIFTGPPRAAADLRSVTVLDGKLLRRSPGVAGTCALLAVLDAMGLVDGSRLFIHEGLVGTTVGVRVQRRERIGEIRVIVPVVDASAWVTGRHEFEVDDRDPLEPFEIA